MAWHKDTNTADGQVTDVYYAILDSGGTVVKGATQATTDTPGSDERHDDPNLARVDQDRFLLTWECDADPGLNRDICYTVFDSRGGLVEAKANASDTFASSFNVDARELSNGNTLIAWHEWHGDAYRIAYSMLNNNYQRITGPVVLDNPAAVTGDDWVSVAADRAGHGILTWMDLDSSYRRHLYYALVDSGGSVLTDPMIFRASQATDPYIFTSFDGYGNARLPSRGKIYLPLLLRNVSHSPYEPNNCAAQAYGPLQPDRSYRAYPDDQEDWYTFNLPGTMDIEVEVTNFAAGGGRLMVYAADDMSSTVPDGDDSSGGPTMRVTPSDLPAGTYYIRVYTGGSTNQSELYTLTFHY